MSEREEEEQVASDELEDQDGEELPDREVMSLISPTPEGIPLPSETDPYEIVVEPRDPRTQYLEP